MNDYTPIVKSVLLDFYEQFKGEDNNPLRFQAIIDADHRHFLIL